MKIFGHFNFPTKSLSEIKLVGNFLFLMYDSNKIGTFVVSMSAQFFSAFSKIY